MDDVEAEYSLTKSRYNAARDNLRSYTRDHPFSLLLALTLMTVIVVLTYYLVDFTKTEHRLEDLKLEKEILADLMKKAQVDYFKKNEISRVAYDIRMKKYRERSIEIDESIPVFRARLERFEGYGFKRLGILSKKLGTQ